jgi:epoxyqueuosine reductase
MEWLSAGRFEAAHDLRVRYPWARAAISLAWPYRPAPGAFSRPPADSSAPGRPRGRVAAYACLRDGAGEPADYHDLLARRLGELLAWLRERVPDLRAKTFIDHGWAMDKPLAERAGVGFAGKNTTLLTAGAGSYVLLAEALVSAPLPATSRSSSPAPRSGSAGPSRPGAPGPEGCGACAACLPACSTGALLAPGVMDARRCISYLTIEHRGPIPLELRPLMGTWVFGCDLCQEACPINRRLAPDPVAPSEAVPERGPVPFPDLVDLLELDETGFAHRFRGTAVARTGRTGLARNAAIALGNAGDRAASGDPDPVVREAAAWALQRLA